VFEGCAGVDKFVSSILRRARVVVMRALG
jgi:hypothetical protein